MVTATTVYDFESNLAAAFAAGLTALGIPAFTPSTAPAVQKPRPRSETIFRPGGSISPPRLSLVGGLRWIAAYTGELTVTSITDASAAGKLAHSAYRAAVRQAMELDSIRAASNISSSPYTIDFIMPTGSSETYATEQGYELSKLTYNVEFSIKSDAFNQLG